MARHIFATSALLILIFLSASQIRPAFGQPRSSTTTADVSAVRAQLERRFQILPVANGIVLTPRFRTDVRSIEITDAIAVDGATVSGGELRQKLGVDADVVLQASYLDAASRRLLAGAATAAAPAPATQAAPQAEPAPEMRRRPSRNIRRDDIVRFGGGITVATGEYVGGDAVAIGGSVDVDGEVGGDTVTVGGSLTLGPHAHIHGDAVVVGGRLNKDPEAIVDGEVTEVGIGSVVRGSRPNWFPGRGFGGWRYAMGAWGLAGTIVRVALVMLLAGIVLLVAEKPVQQIADRAAAEPVKSWAVGFLVEILFVPVLVLTVVVLAVSIVGIPLLLLIPVAILAALIVSLIGFTGIAFHLGRLIETRFEQVRNRPYLTTVAGIALIVSPVLLARVVGLIPGLDIFSGILVAAGIALEYIAWTAGLGAAVLSRFGRPRPEPAAPPAPPPALAT